MPILTKNPTPSRANHQPLGPWSCGAYVKSLWVLLLAGTIMLSGCGSGTSSSTGNSQIPLTLSGNWQFNMAEQLNPDPTKPSFRGGLQGGFLVQTKDAVTGAAIYSITTEPPAGSGGTPSQCNNGTAEITGTLSDRIVTLTAAAAGGQTFNLTGTLSFDGSTMTGSYTSTDGAGCGIAATQAWSAILVPPLTGSIQGSFHSTGGGAGLNEQEFLVSGALIQADNTGASAATVTGNLNFFNATNDLSDYPCLDVASVTGQISGNSVFLQIIGSGGSPVGQIGQTAPAGSNPQAVTFNSTQNGYALQSLAGAGYSLTTNACQPNADYPVGDQGNICLALNSTTTCQQPVTLTPSALIFPSQPLDSPPAILTITLANTSGSVLSGLTLKLISDSNSGPPNFTETFTETDTCLGGPPSQGAPFNLAKQQSCVVTIMFSPQQSCAAGTLSTQCLTATLTVTSPNNNAILSLPIIGGVSSTAASIHELNFGAGRNSEASLPQNAAVHQSGVMRIPHGSSALLQDMEHHAEIH